MEQVNLFDVWTDLDPDGPASMSQTTHRAWRRGSLHAVAPEDQEQDHPLIDLPDVGLGVHDERLLANRLALALATTRWAGPSQDDRSRAFWGTSKVMAAFLLVEVFGHGDHYYIIKVGTSCYQAETLVNVAAFMLTKGVDYEAG